MKSSSQTVNKKRTSPVILLVAGAVMVLLDQITKYLAVQYLAGRPPKVIIPGVLELQYLENNGAAFSMLQNQQWFFYILTAVFLIAAIALMRRVPRDTSRFNPLLWCVTVLCAGAVGNLIDRIFHKYVVDFIYFSIIHFPVFNVADIFVTLSVIVLIILVLFYYKDADLQEIFKKKQRAD
ncbi:MAG: signal peptidase II [Eubacterium sp.]|nr:signal peptidase II [Eubacterium sp.]